MVCQLGPILAIPSTLLRMHRAHLLNILIVRFTTLLSQPDLIISFSWFLWLELRWSPCFWCSVHSLGQRWNWRWRDTNGFAYHYTYPNCYTDCHRYPLQLHCCRCWNRRVDCSRSSLWNWKEDPSFGARRSKSGRDRRLLSTCLAQRH